MEMGIALEEGMDLRSVWCIKLSRVASLLYVEVREREREPSRMTCGSFVLVIHNDQTKS